MKTQKAIKLVFLSMAMLFIANLSYAQKDKKYAEATFKSTVVCNMCQERVEEGMAFEKGVKDVKVDLKKKTVYIKYKPSKTNEEKLKKAISMIGYDADDVSADSKAYDKLPACCKRDVDPH
ncbi:MAG: cation transporter [Hyphomicrobiales bacterium]